MGEKLEKERKIQMTKLKKQEEKKIKYINEQKIKINKQITIERQKAKNMFIAAQKAEKERIVLEKEHKIEQDKLNILKMNAEHIAKERKKNEDNIMNQLKI